MIMLPLDRHGVGLRTAPFRRYKSWLHEGGITSPMIAWWPEHVKANSINRDVAHIIDIMPTLLELGDGKYPSRFNDYDIIPVEGLSMVPLFDQNNRASHEQLCWYWSGNRAIRQGNWKLVWDKLNNKKVWELYDLSKDRCELNDLAKSDPDRVQKMKEDWFAWADKVGFKAKK